MKNPKSTSWKFLVWPALGILAGLTAGMADQPQVFGAKTFPKSEIDAVLATGSGISGPGKPFTGSFENSIANGPGASSTSGPGSAVARGLLPPMTPIWDVHMRDTNVILGGDGNYYLTGSTGTNIWNYNDGIELWKSTDLRHWKYLGLIWSLEKEGGWEKSWREKKGKPIRSIWAPELHYIHHTYYLCFGMPPGGMAILKSVSGKAEGPYVHATDPQKPLLGGIGPLNVSFLIDPTLFEDDDGKVYFTYGPGNEIARMKDDLSDFAEPLRSVVLHDAGPYDSKTQRDKDHPFGFEGATLFKRNGIYYFGSTDKYLGRYSMCMAMSSTIYGPYHTRHESVPSNGGTDFFKAKDGFWYSCLFGDDSQAPWRSMPGVIRIDFDPDGKIIVAKNQPSFVSQTTP